MNEIKNCWRKYFGFGGKAGLEEFWKWCFFVLGVTVVMVGIMAAAFAIGGNRIPPSPAYEVTCRVLLIVSGGFLLAVLCPSLAVASRRLRDAGISPWWLLLPIALCVASFLVFMDGALAGMSEMEPSVPMVWQVACYFVTAVTGFIFICLFCKKSKE